MFDDSLLIFHLKILGLVPIDNIHQNKDSHHIDIQNILNFLQKLCLMLIVIHSLSKPSHSFGNVAFTKPQCLNINVFLTLPSF